MKDNVRILVLGDEGVGKSSLISAFVSQCFPEKVREGGREVGWVIEGGRR
jgi:GTPase SAR1 family protein